MSKSMSEKNSSRRINLSFKQSSPEQMQAYELLSGMESKTEYVTQLVLSNAGIEPKQKNGNVLTREDLRAVLTELLPQILANDNTMRSKLLGTAGEAKPDVDASLDPEQRKAPDEPIISSNDGTSEAETKDGDVGGWGTNTLDLDIPDDFMQDIAGMVGL